jgi:hypothetical protein
VKVLLPFIPVFARAAEAYIVKNARQYRQTGRALSSRELDAIGRYFPVELTRRVLLSPADPPLKPPTVQEVARWFGYGRLLEPEATAGITFNDVIVYVQPMSVQTLFHEFVHAEQYRQLGVALFARKYVSGFLRTGVYEQIPLERHAYELDSRFAENPGRAFSVQGEVRGWMEEGRY